MVIQALNKTIVMERIIFQKNCMLQKQNEKKEKDKDEAYYVNKIENLCKSSSKPTLVVTEDNNDVVNIEVWSIDSEDEEVHRTTHVNA